MPTTRERYLTRVKKADAGKIRAACRILRTMREQVLTDESRWVKGNLATNKGAYPVAVLDRTAYRYCLLGALSKARHILQWEVHDEIGEASVVVEYALQACLPHGYTTKGVAAFNDASRTSFEDVRTLMQKATEIVCSTEEAAEAEEQAAPGR